MRIAFIWFGINGRYGQWKDGLYAAMRIIGQKHEVRYFDPSDDVESFKPDWVLFWEAPICYQGKDGEMYRRVCSLPFRKALLFAGGEIKPMWVKDFDHIFVESAIDAEACGRFGLPHSRAFGINDSIFRTQEQPKIFDAMHHATCASWKRTWLMTGGLGAMSMVCGRFQPHDPKCFDDARRDRALVLPEQSAESVASLLNASHCLAQTSGFWGGGQRATLEAIACGIPVVATRDSPKNCEFVAASGYGVICDPTVESVKNAVKDVKSRVWDKEIAIEYIRENWTAQKYADDILKCLI